MTTILENIKLDENLKPLAPEPSGKCDKCGVSNVPITKVSVVAGLFFSAKSTSGKSTHSFSKLLEVVSQGYCNQCTKAILSIKPSRVKLIVKVSKITLPIFIILGITGFVGGYFSVWPFIILALISALGGFAIDIDSEDEIALSNHVCEQFVLRKQEYISKYKLYTSFPVFTLEDNISLRANDLSEFFKFRSIDDAKKAIFGGFIFDHFGNQWYHRTLEDQK
jgi:hypothetical protein